MAATWLACGAGDKEPGHPPSDQGASLAAGLSYLAPCLYLVRHGAIAVTYSLTKTSMLAGVVLAAVLVTPRLINVPTTTVSAIASAVSYVPIISLVPYAARPGQSVEVQGHGFAPNEVVRLIVGRASVARTHADTDGAIRLHVA